MGLIGWLLGLDRVTELHDVRVFLAAPWVREGAFWLFLAAVASILVTTLYYRRLQRRVAPLGQFGLGVLRAFGLLLLIVTLANPFLTAGVTRQVEPTVHLLLDATESMRTRDAGQTGTNEFETRLAAVGRALIGDSPVFNGLVGEPRRLEAWVLKEGTVQPLAATPVRSQSELVELIRGLEPSGGSSSLGEMLHEFARDHVLRRSSAVVFVSDFAHHSGLPSLDQLSALGGVPVFTVGVGRSDLTDVAVELVVESKVKQRESTEITVVVRQSNLNGTPARIRVLGRRVDLHEAALRLVDEQQIVLAEEETELSVKWLPDEAGVWQLVARVDRIDGEASFENNEATELSEVIEGSLRLLYIAFEPTWEWRFVKEAFHRDRLVGMEGLRTYLDSADPEVRRSNPLFLEQLPAKRSELLQYDLVVLDDVPAELVSSDFAEWLHEFVDRFGGGLVVMAGPRFGLRHFSATDVGRLLPVRVDESSGWMRESEFTPRLTAPVSLFPFMQLGDAAKSNEDVWGRLESLPWYHSVQTVAEQAFVLLEHPSDVSADGKGEQPLVVLRRYGRGEVLYVGFNELWRLRQATGELYHRKLWSRLVYRLGMSHPLGNDKRFAVRTDRSVYPVDEEVVVRVSAYDQDYQPLREEHLGSAPYVVAGALQKFPEDGPPVPLSLTAVGDGEFETRVRIPMAGDYRVQISDPITGDDAQSWIVVRAENREQLKPNRNRRLQRELAASTNGRSYDLFEQRSVVDDLPLLPTFEESRETRSLWNTPLWFMLAAGVLLTEWAARRWLHLP